MDDANLDEHGRPMTPPTGDEVTMLNAFLDFHRATLEWRCRGLDAEALQRTTAASTLTLGGLLKHMALVEESWFSERLHGRDLGPPWDAVDWDADPDWELHSAARDSPDALLAQWRRSVELARAGIVEALADGGLDRPLRHSWSDGRTPSLRWTMLHMIEEYARHNGHADLIRESIDGESGE